MSDFRAKYYLEAERNIRQANEDGHGRLRAWYSLLCAIANATMAAVPDNVLVSIIKDEEQKTRNQGSVQRGIRKNLNGK